ncbi:hypothetical protein D3C72_1333200 [compost metagenome]
MADAVQRSADQHGADIVEEDAEGRPHRQGGEEAVDHGRHAREDLEQRLDHGAGAATGVFRQIDGREQADRSRHHHGDHHDQEGAGEQRHGPEGARRPDLVGADRHLRAPLGPEQELGDRHGGEETQGVPDQREDDAHGRQNRHRRTGEQDDADPAFHPVAGAQVGTDADEDEDPAQDGRDQGGDPAAPVQGRRDAVGATAFGRQLLGIGRRPDLLGFQPVADAARVREEGFATEGLQLGDAIGRARRQHLALKRRGEDRSGDQHDQSRHADPDQGVEAMLARARMGPDALAATRRKAAPAQIGEHREADQQ